MLEWHLTSPGRLRWAPGGALTTLAIIMFSSAIPGHASVIPLLRHRVELFNIKFYYFSAKFSYLIVSWTNTNFGANKLITIHEGHSIRNWWRKKWDDSLIVHPLHLFLVMMHLRYFLVPSILHIPKLSLNLFYVSQLTDQIAMYHLLPLLVRYDRLLLILVSFTIVSCVMRYTTQIVCSLFTPSTHAGVASYHLILIFGIVV